MADAVDAAVVVAAVAAALAATGADSAATGADSSHADAVAFVADVVADAAGLAEVWVHVEGRELLLNRIDMQACIW